jgi:adenine-specific DNA-methyltransferase
MPTRRNLGRPSGAGYSGPIAAEGENVLVNGQADDVLESLASAAVQPRLFLIDPPYNRRTKFHHYSDSQRRDDWLEDRTRQARLMRDLLTDDGSFWMHIDDSEVATSRMMLDEIFGPANFIATIVWQKTVSRDNRTPLSTTHEYVLAYARNKTVWHRSRNKLPATPEQLRRYSNPDDDPRGPWTSGDLTAKAGPGRRQAQFFDLVTPSGRVVRPASGTAWRYTRERLQELIDDGRVDFGNGNKMPRLKRFLGEVDPGLVPDTWWSGEQVGTADSAKRHLKSLFPELVPFETPKPEPLAARIINIATNPGDLVVDVYAGSGTTASVAHKLGRRWVAVEREATTFREFTRPRLELVVKGLDPGGVTLQSAWSGGGTFAVLGD